MRVVAVSGQWIELQCPLVSELMPPSASASASASGSSSQQQLYSIQWRKSKSLPQNNGRNVGTNERESNGYITNRTFACHEKKDGVRLDQLNPRYKINLANGSLLVANSQPKVDEANYECWLVRNHNNNRPASSDQQTEEEPLKSHRLELRLLVAPRVVPFEFPADAQVGMKLVLTCSVLEGQQPISFVWLKDNKIISADERPMGPVVGSAGGARASSLAQLHQQQLADKYAMAPLPYSMGRAGQGNYKASEYSLLLNETGREDLNQQQQQAALLPLLSDANMRVRQSDDYSILSIDKLELKHSGRYTCSVQNEAARTGHSSQLLINGKFAANHYHY